MKLLFKPKLKINSIEQANQLKDFTVIAWPVMNKVHGIPVSLLLIL